jgi:hypothetical protein
MGFPFKLCEHHGGGFAQAGWNVDQLRLAARAVAENASSIGRFATGQPALVGVGSLLVTAGGLKEFSVGHEALQGFGDWKGR